MFPHCSGLKFSSGPAEDTDIVAYRSTFIFNAFVFCQVFNEFNARSLTDDPRIWRGLLGNRIFLGVIAVSVFVQAVFVQVRGVT